MIRRPRRPDRSRSAGPPDGAPFAGEEGFALVEVIAASVILMITVVSMTTLLVDSLSATLLTRQRSQAATLGGDLVENAKALGRSALVQSASGSPPCNAVSGPPVPVRTQSDFRQCFTSTVDNTTYTVTPAISTASGAPVTVTITVTWSSPIQTYVTTGIVGT